MGNKNNKCVYCYSVDYVIKKCRNKCNICYSCFNKLIDNYKKNEKNKSRVNNLKEMIQKKEIPFKIWTITCFLCQNKMILCGNYLRCGYKVRICSSHKNQFKQTNQIIYGINCNGKVYYAYESEKDAIRRKETLEKIYQREEEDVIIEINKILLSDGIKIYTDT